MTATLDTMKAAQTYAIDKMHSEVAFHPWGNVRAGFETSMTINRKDFGLTWNAALETGGFLVGDEVRIDLSIQAVALS